jgi:hypothetical protein
MFERPEVVSEFCKLDNISVDPLALTQELAVCFIDDQTSFYDLETHIFSKI